MDSTQLNYASACTLPRRAWPWKKLFLTAGVLVALLGAATVEVSTADTQIDAVTGTMLRKTSWRFGFTSGVRMDVSPLETRLKQSGIPWTPSWRYMNSNGQNVFGMMLSRGCSSGPPIYLIRFMLNEFVNTATDAELREFIRVTQTGSDEQQKAAVEAAANKALEFMKTGARGN